MSDRQALMKAGGGVQAIVPQSFEEAWRVAQVLSASGMTPKDINTPEKVVAVIMAGAEIGMAPFQALQSFALINGRPALWGDGMLATARKFGVKVSERIEGEGDAAIAYCVVERPDTGEKIERPFSMADAKKAGLSGKQGPWTQYPKRMLQMRARAWALRDGCADMLRGMRMAEEAQDYAVITNERIDEHDQRTDAELQEEGKGAFIFGEAWGLVETHYKALFDAAASLDDLEKQWKSFNRKYWIGERRCISNNSRDGMEHLYEQAKERFETAETLYPKLCDEAHDKTDGAALEEWFGSALTQARIARLPDEHQKDIATLYEDKQEQFAEAEAAARKAK